MQSRISLEPFGTAEDHQPENYPVVVPSEPEPEAKRPIRVEPDTVVLFSHAVEADGSSLSPTTEYLMEQNRDQIQHGQTVLSLNEVELNTLRISELYDAFSQELEAIKHDAISIGLQLGVASLHSALPSTLRELISKVKVWQSRMQMIN